MAYLVTFILAGLSGGCCEKAKNKRLRAFLFAVMILLPSILGGLRSLEVGTDNYNVYEPIFRRFAQASSVYDAIFRVNIQVEYGFLGLTFIITRFTSDYHWFCFITSFMTNLFFALGCYKFSKQVPIYLSFGAYLFMFYCQNINLVRQGLALSICFFAFYYIIEGKCRKYCLWVALAATFHVSAVIALVLYPIYYIIKNKKMKLSQAWIIAAAVIGYLILPSILRFLLNAGLVYEKIERYIPPNILMFNPLVTIQRLPLLVLTTVFLKSKLGKDTLYKYIHCLLIVEVVLVQYSIWFDPIQRIGLYFRTSSILILPMCCKGVNRRSRPYIMALIIIYLFAYWYYFTVSNHYGYTMPVYPYIMG